MLLNWRWRPWLFSRKASSPPRVTSLARCMRDGAWPTTVRSFLFCFQVSRSDHSLAMTVVQTPVSFLFLYLPGSGQAGPKRSSKRHPLLKIFNTRVRPTGTFHQLSLSRSMTVCLIGFYMILDRSVAVKVWKSWFLARGLDHHTARTMIGYWHDSVVCPSVCLWRCVLSLNDTYTAKVSDQVNRKCTYNTYNTILQLPTPTPTPMLSSQTVHLLNRIDIAAVWRIH